MPNVGARTEQRQHGTSGEFSTQYPSSTKNHYMSRTCVLFMPKTFDRAPELPKLRRRIGRDTTELMITSLALLSSVVLFGILIRQPTEWFDIESSHEYERLMYGMLITTIVLWGSIIRLELTAKSKAEKLYKVQMNEYEIMRTKWLEIASQKMDIEAKRSMEPMKVVQSGQVPVKQIESKVDEKSTEAESRND